jgi:hypothetical protein
MFINVVNELERMTTGKGEKLSELTKKGYMTRLKSVYKLLNQSVNLEECELDYLLDVNKVISIIETSSLRGKEQYYLVILRLLNHLDEVKYKDITNKYYEYYVKNKVDHEHEVNENKVKDVDAYKYMSVKEVLYRLEEYNIRSPSGVIIEKALLYKLIVSFYFMNSSNYIPRGEIRSFIIAGRGSELEDDKNYVVLNARGGVSHLVLNRYKTYRTYGQQLIKVSKELKSVLNEYIKYFRIGVGDYLIRTKSNVEMSETNFSTLVSTSFLNITGRGITTDIARHIQVSEFNNNMPSMNERKKMAKVCLHSVDNSTYYIKLDANKE